MYRRVVTLKLIDVSKVHTASFISLITEKVRISETSGNLKVTTRPYIPEDSILHTRRRVNLKSHTDGSMISADRRNRQSHKQTKITGSSRVLRLGYSLKNTYKWECYFYSNAREKKHFCWRSVLMHTFDCICAVSVSLLIALQSTDNDYGFNLVKLKAASSKCILKTFEDT
jgi:hypothetical protein